MASIDIPSIKGLHTLRMNSDLDNCIVVSLIDVTHVIQLNGEELEDTEMPGNVSAYFVALLIRGF